MTQKEFWSLYDSGAIQCKVFEWHEGLESKKVTSFEHNGKFFLRVTNEVHGTSWVESGTHKKRHTRGWIRSQIKEFDTKANANNYFKKVFEGCEYKKAQG